MASPSAASFSSEDGALSWHRLLRTLSALLLLPLLLAGSASAQAGVLDKAAMARRFPAPLIVGDKQSDIPVWPLFKQNATATELVGYAFESIDLAPIPGFSGVPLNLLVAIDPQGGFLDVAVLSHHEPVFLDGLGEAPLFAFVKQYQVLSLKQNIVIDSKTKRLRAPDAGHAYLDGVSKATASVRIINQSVLSAALKVSRKKLGFGQGADPDQIARVRTTLFEPKRAQALLDEGLIGHLRLTNRCRTTVQGQRRCRPRRAGAGAARCGGHRSVPDPGVGADHRPQSPDAGELEQAAAAARPRRPCHPGHVARTVWHSRRGFRARQHSRPPGSQAGQSALRHARPRHGHAPGHPRSLADRSDHGAAGDRPVRPRSGPATGVFPADHAQQGHHLSRTHHAQRAPDHDTAGTFHPRARVEQQVLARHLAQPRA